MKYGALVCEYNPFHNGHQYQIEKIKNISDNAPLIAIMSGNFVQRGGVAVIDKYDRAKLALLAGVDLVVQLPFIFSAQRAETFSFGSMGIVDALGCSEVYFGCEYEDVGLYKYLADILNDESVEFKQILSKFLNSNVSYPKARILALSELTGRDCSFLETPNNILSLEYIRKLKKQNSKVDINMLSRVTEYKGREVISASKIRERNFKDEKIQDYIPREKYDKEHSFRSIEEYKDIIRAKLEFSSAKEFAEVIDCEIGLANRMKNYCGELKDSVDSYLSAVCTKTHTKAKIRRILINSILNLRYSTFECELREIEPNYVRILGANEVGKSLVKYINNNCKISLVPSVYKSYAELSEQDKKIALIDDSAEKLYSFFDEHTPKDIKRSPVFIG